MEKENFWKIFNSDKSVVILTHVAKEYDVNKIVKKLQKVFGDDLCSFQKFDERFDKIEDFDIILRTSYNVWGNRLISATLFEHTKENDDDFVTINKQKTFRIIPDSEFTYKFLKRTIKASHCWDGFRRHLCQWMNFCPGEFDSLTLDPIIELESNRQKGIADLICEDAK